MTNLVQPFEEPKINYFQKLWAYRRHLMIEAFVFFNIMPSLLNYVALQNFPLEKACRVNLGYKKLICATILDKGELGIDCDVYKFENTTAGGTPELMSLSVYSPDFNYTVCKAESEVQKLSAAVSGKSAPAAAIFPLIVLLFAGGWADRYNKRKPCMILPTVGQVLSYAFLLVSAIYFEDLPLEFGAYLGTIVPSLFGGGTLIYMAVNSYITIATPESDRVFRFGVFAIFLMVVPFMGLPLSGWLYQKLGYTMSFTLGLVMQLVGIFYAIFFIKEIKPTDKQDEAGTADTFTNDASPFEQRERREGVNADKKISFELTMDPKETQCDKPPKVAVELVKRPLWRELFDYTLLKDLIRFPFIERKNNARLLLNLLLVAEILTLGPPMGEGEYWYLYALRKLGWNGTDCSFFSTFSTGMAILGNFIGTGILSKIFKFTDPAVGVLSACTTVMSSLVFAFAKNSTMFYFGGVSEMFSGLRAIAIKSMGSSIVNGDELSKMFSVFGICGRVGQFIFPPLYSIVYQATVDSFPGAIYLFSEIFYIPNVMVFVFCYFLLRRRRRKTDREVAANAQNGCSTSTGHAKPDSEITSQ